MQTIKRIIIWVWVAGFSFTSITAQTEGIGTEDSLLLNKTIRQGRLPNGFTYYIKPIERPQKKLYMNLFIKVGNYHQNDTQLDFAHALEHLAFKGGKHFPNHILNDMELLNRLGMEKNDINARTALEFTKYNFNPSSNYLAEGLNSGLLFFRDIATDLRLTNEDIATERGPLRQELIYRQGGNLNEYFAQTKLDSKLFPCSNDHTNFFEHNKYFSKESLVEFYKHWYRPDLMALIIVGNVENMDEIEEKIKSNFSDIKRPTNLIETTDCESDYFSRPKQFVLIEREPERSSLKADNNVKFELLFRDMKTREKINSREGLTRNLAWVLLAKILDERFKESMKVYNSFFKASSRYSYKNHPSALKVTINSKNNEDEKVLLETILLMNQLKRYGVSSVEWIKVKQDHLRDLEKLDPEDADYWMDQMGNHFIYGEALLDNKPVGLKKWLSNLSLAEFNELIKELMSDMPEDIGIIAPSGHKALAYKEKEVRGWIKQANTTDTKAYISPKAPIALMNDKELSALKLNGYIDKGKRKSGAHELILDNGIKVVLKSYKPSVGKDQNRIMLHGFSPKGASCFPKEDYFSAINSPHIVRNSGVGRMDKFELSRFLVNTSFWQGVFPYIDYYETGIKGNAKIEDLENMLQLVYLYLTKPRKDQASFQDWRKNEFFSYLNPSYNVIVRDFGEGIGEVLGDRSNNPGGTKGIEGVELTDVDKTYEIYQQLFGNPEDFTFVITGNFSIDNALPLIQKYLGNLPNIPVHKSCIPIALSEKRLPKGPLYKRIKTPDSFRMVSTEYSMRFVIKAEDRYDWKEQIKAEALGVYMTRKIKKLRFEDGAALYKMVAGHNFSDYLGWYKFYISLDCIPEELGWLRQECKKIITEMKSKPLNKDIIEEISKSVLYPKYGTDRAEQNGQMIEKLYRTYRYDVPWLEASETENYIHSLTMKDIQKTAKKYFKDENLFEFVMGNDEFK